MANGRAELPLEMQILEAFQATSQLVMGPTDLARILGISKGTISDKLRLLAEHQYLDRDGGGKYRPGPKVFGQALSYLGLVMRQLEQTQEVVNSNLDVIRQAMQPIAAALQTGGSQ